ncbi:MAG: 4Fe-4S dicluster domain-containing protein [Fretibacterium sp.]|nr:4Fe-4S dicluster domain-containing protein [Fretibacterium sp.]
MVDKKRFKVGVNNVWCKGCSLCINVCPKSVLQLSDRQKAEVVRESDCIGCRQCENICPDLAITVKEDEANG